MAAADAWCSVPMFQGDGKAAQEIGAVSKEINSLTVSAHSGLLVNSGSPFLSLFSPSSLSAVV